ncbi:hypothetical protein V8C86DRAFT_2714255, partial [Haematococcus lacustris]
MAAWGSHLPCMVLVWVCRSQRDPGPLHQVGSHRPPPHPPRTPRHYPPPPHPVHPQRPNHPGPPRGSLAHPPAATP